MVFARQQHLTEVFNELIKEFLVSLPRIHHLLQFNVATLKPQPESRSPPSRRSGYVVKGHSYPLVETDIKCLKTDQWVKVMAL